MHGGGGRYLKNLRKMKKKIEPFFLLSYDAQKDRNSTERSWTQSEFDKKKKKNKKKKSDTVTTLSHQIIPKKESTLPPKNPPF